MVSITYTSSQSSNEDDYDGSLLLHGQRVFQIANESIRRGVIRWIIRVVRCVLVCLLGGTISINRFSSCLFSVVMTLM